MHIGVWANYFSKRDYFQLDLAKGVLQSRGKARVMTFPREFTVGLLAGLVDECGEAWPVVLHKCGQWWGRRHMERTMAELAAFYGTDVRELPTGVAHAAVAQGFAIHGWGKVTFDLTRIPSGLLVVEVESSPFVAAAKDGGLDLGDKPVDEVLAGALGSMLSVASGMELGGHEIACAGRGDPSCVFVVASPPKLANLSTLVRRREPVTDILRSVASS